MFRFNFVFFTFMVTVVVNSKSKTWKVWADNAITGEDASRIWNWDQFVPAFINAMAEHGMAPEISEYNGHISLERWEDHFFDEGKYVYSIASGRFEYIDDLVYDEVILPKTESTAPARQRWNWWGGTSKELRDFKRRVRRYNRWVK